MRLLFSILCGGRDEKGAAGRQRQKGRAPTGLLPGRGRGRGVRPRGTRTRKRGAAPRDVAEATAHSLPLPVRRGEGPGRAARDRGRSAPRQRSYSLFPVLRGKGGSAGPHEIANEAHRARRLTPSSRYAGERAGERGSAARWPTPRRSPCAAAHSPCDSHPTTRHSHGWRTPLAPSPEVTGRGREGRVARECFARRKPLVTGERPPARHASPAIERHVPEPLSPALSPEYREEGVRHLARHAWPAMSRRAAEPLSPAPLPEVPGRGRKAPSPR